MKNFSLHKNDWALSGQRRVELSAVRDRFESKRSKIKRNEANYFFFSHTKRPESEMISVSLRVEKNSTTNLLNSFINIKPMLSFSVWMSAGLKVYSNDILELHFVSSYLVSTISKVLLTYANSDLLYWTALSQLFILYLSFVIPYIFFLNTW